MKRRIFIATTALAASVGFAGTAAAQTKWDFATAYPAHNFHSKNNEQFVKDVEAATQGKLKITPHFGASLFKMPEIKRAVQTGNAQMGEFFLVSFQNEAPIFGADGLPFLVGSYDDAYKLYQAQKPAGQAGASPAVFRGLASARHLHQKACELGRRPQRHEVARVLPPHRTHW